jgi:hypothetical protein
MTRFSLGVGCITIVLGLACLKTDLRAEEPAPRDSTLVDGGSYVVGSPPGDGWESQVNTDREMVTFTRLERTPKGVPLGGTFISVNHSAATKPKWQLNTYETAIDYLAAKQRFVIKDAAKEHLTLRDMNVDSVVVGDKKLYSLVYSAWKGTDEKTSHPIERSVVYIYFPPDFPEKHEFFNLQVWIRCMDCTTAKLDFAVVKPVIQKLRMK